VHHPFHSFPTHSLYRLGEKLFVRVIYILIYACEMFTKIAGMYRQLFGEGEDAIGELDEAENQGEDCVFLCQVHINLS
jgi:hypothetical protein